MNILILGPQASGKGTQGRLLGQKYNLRYFDFGEHLREVAKGDSRVGKIINKQGRLLPDLEIFSIVSKYLEKNAPDPDGTIFDGFPRKISQYDFLNKYLRRFGRRIDLVIFLDLPKSESVRRLLARRVCKKCGAVYNLITNPPKMEGVCNRCNGGLVKRQDDREETIKKRLDFYRTATLPLINFLKSKGTLVSVDATKSIEEIFSQIQRQLEKRGLING